MCMDRCCGVRSKLDARCWVGRRLSYRACSLMQQSRREVVCGVEEEDVIRYDIAGFVVGVKEKALKLPDKDSMQHGDVRRVI